MWNCLAYLVEEAAKYVFHAAVFIITPLGYRGFYYRYGEFPSVFVCVWVLTLEFMALWSHYLASKPHDPGFVAWKHFRTPA